MSKILTKLIALTTACIVLFTFSSCKKDEEKNTQNQVQDQKPSVHECTFSNFVVIEYPSFGRDGKAVGDCSCGKTGEKTLSWKENVLLNTKDIDATDEYGYTDEKINNIISAYTYNYYHLVTAEDMYKYDNKEFPGQEGEVRELDSVTKGEYTIFVNRYTGVMYYRNNTTGEIIASNQYIENLEDPMLTTKRSQLVVTYKDKAGNTYVMNNIEYASGLNKVETSVTENGIRVSYILGDTNERHTYAVPMWIEAHEFEKDILRPMMNTFHEKMNELLGEEYAINYFEGTRKIYAAVEGGNPNNKVLQELDEKYYNEQSVYENRFLHDESLRVFFDDLESMIKAHRVSYINAGVLQEDCLQKEKEIQEIAAEIQRIVQSYRIYNPSHPKFIVSDSLPQKVIDGTSMYCIREETPERLELIAEAIEKYCPDYTFEMMLEDEKWCEYPYVVNPSSAFNVDIEYTFNDDGSFSVNLLWDSVIYNDLHFELVGIELMHDYGNGKIVSGEHIFLPSEMIN